MKNTPNNSFESKRFLVTGGAGFIGSHIIESLLKCGAIVTCLDNFATGKKANVNSFLGNSSFTLIEGDIRDFETCKRAVSGCDYVSHQAALGSVPRSINDPLTTNEVNVTGFLNMLEASRQEQVLNFVYAASSSVYGSSKELPKIEFEIGEPLSPYSLTKSINEMYASVYKKTYDFNSIGLRYFNVFGPKQDPEGAYAAVIPQFVKKIKNHEAPVINGDGSFSRDYTYIQNVVQANLLALGATGNTVLNEVYNVAYGARLTLVELVYKIKEQLLNYDHEVKDIEPVFGPERKGDVPHSLASITKARQLLGYDPQYDVSLGLKETIAWYQNNLN